MGRGGAGEGSLRGKNWRCGGFGFASDERTRLGLRFPASGYNVREAGAADKVRPRERRISLLIFRCRWLKTGRSHLEQKQVPVESTNAKPLRIICIQSIKVPCYCYRLRRQHAYDVSLVGLEIYLVSFQFYVAFSTGGRELLKRSGK